MRKILLPAVCFLSAGCVMTAAPAPSKPAYEMVITTQILPGMSKKSVATLLGDKVVIGYEKSKIAGGEFVPITIKNPYRSETLRGSGKTFEADFYFTEIRNSDGIISDDELTPFVFEGGVLTGKGWPYLHKIKERHQLQP